MIRQNNNISCQCNIPTTKIVFSLGKNLQGFTKKHVILRAYIPTRVKIKSIFVRKNVPYDSYEHVSGKVTLYLHARKLRAPIFAPEHGNILKPFSEKSTNPIKGVLFLPCSNSTYHVRVHWVQSLKLNSAVRRRCISRHMFKFIEQWP